MSHAAADGDKDDQDKKGDDNCDSCGTVTEKLNAAGSRSKRYVLGKLVALSKVSDQLAQFENLVVMDLSSELVEVFLAWDSSCQTLPSTNSSFFGGSDGGSNAMPIRSKVKNIVKALQKCQKLSSVADSYRDKLCDTIRVTVRTTVNECAADAGKNEELLPSSVMTADVTTTPTTTNKTVAAEVQKQQGAPKSSITEGITSMTFRQFMECMDMVFEQVLGLLESATGVSKFFREEGILLRDDDKGAELHTKIGLDNTGSSVDISTTNSSSPSALFSASDLSQKSITELLRLRKEAHSLVTFEEMKRLWDSCLTFTLQIEKFSGQKAYALRSTLLAQAKAFVERRHEGNMSSLVAALDGERWTQCDVSSERQATLTRLCSGRAVFPSSRSISTAPGKDSNSVVIEGKSFRTVWSCLLLVEMIMHNVSCAAHFQTLATNAVSKITELLRRFNSRATQLVLGAGAIHSAAKLKSINAKHLALVTQCVGIVLAILPHVRAALMAQLPSKQHGLLGELDKIKKEYLDHSEMVLCKFVNIIGGIVEHGLVPRIAKTNFDERAASLTLATQQKANEGDGTERLPLSCCPFLEAVNTNTKKMHQVLLSNLPTEDLSDVFSRIFAYLDSKIPTLFINADTDKDNPFSFPTSEEGKRRMVIEVEEMAITLNGLANVRPWDFAAMKFLERRLDISSDEEYNVQEVQDAETNDLIGGSGNLNGVRSEQEVENNSQIHQAQANIQLNGTEVQEATQNKEGCIPAQEHLSEGKGVHEDCTATNLSSSVSTDNTPAAKENEGANLDAETGDNKSVTKEAKSVKVEPMSNVSKSENDDDPPSSIESTQIKPEEQ